jgi:hypothetical protein
MKIAKNLAALSPKGESKRFPDIFPVWAGLG